MSTLERRVEVLEAARGMRKSRIAVIKQNGDGSWPEDPSGASLVIGIRNFTFMADEAAPTTAEDWT
ncbi:MAG: hypothetical protein ACREFT_01040 [Acetobacteraceae bacterium]